MEKSLQVKVETMDMAISVEDIKKFIAPKATDKELFMFMGISKAYGLNPLKREIHFVKYGDSPASIIVGYETYLKRAERTGKLDGWKCWIDKDALGEKAVIEIKRKDHSMPIRWEVYRNEFDKQQSTWKSMPTFMLKKVAIAQGFRLAFPEEIGGMPYIPEEMPDDKGGKLTSEKLATADVTDVTPEKPQESPSGAPESPASGDNLSDDEVIKEIRQKIAEKAKGMSPETVDGLITFACKGNETVDMLQDVLDNFLLHRKAFMKSKEA